MSRPRVEVVCVGTELLTGKVNTHTAYLGRALSGIGLSISRDQTVGDDPADMKAAFRSAWSSADIVICCGGLGPTFDDITRDVWSRVTGRPLRLQTSIVDDIREKFRLRGIPMPSMNRRQGLVLQGAEVLPNANGTAPGQFLPIGRKTLVLLPGPARELTAMVENELLLRLRVRTPQASVVQKSFHMVGVPESHIDGLVRPLVKRLATVNGCRLTHGILASNSIITVKFSVTSSSAVQAGKAAAQAAGQFRRLLKPYLFGEDSDSLPSVIGMALRRQGKTLATAESCTGGLIAKLITDESGASDYFVQGAVTYSNQSKIRLLGVSSKTLARYGAVSSQTAQEMAKGIRAKARTDFGVSVTGIAGPTGGSKEKPIGLVFIGLSSRRRTGARKFQFTGDRDWIRHRAALMALDLLRKEI